MFPLFHVSLGSGKQRKGKGHFHLGPMEGAPWMGGASEGDEYANVRLWLPHSLATGPSLWECVTPASPERPLCHLVLSQRCRMSPSAHRGVIRGP